MVWSTDFFLFLSLCIHIYLFYISNHFKVNWENWFNLITPEYDLMYIWYQAKKQTERFPPTSTAAAPGPALWACPGRAPSPQPAPPRRGARGAQQQRPLDPGQNPGPAPRGNPGWDGVWETEQTGRAGKGLESWASQRKTPYPLPARGGPRLLASRDLWVACDFAWRLLDGKLSFILPTELTEHLIGSSPSAGF